MKVNMNTDSEYKLISKITHEIGRPNAIFFNNDGKIDIVRADFGEGIHHDTQDLLAEDVIIYTERQDKEII